MKPGEKLAKLLGKGGKSALAKAIGMSPTSVGRYLVELDEDTIDDGAWLKIARALESKFGIKPETIRALPVLSIAFPSNEPPLTPLLDQFRDEQLAALLRIMKAPRERLEPLIAVAEYRLQHSKKN
jgi:hypothetical protein